MTRFGRITQSTRVCTRLKQAQAISYATGRACFRAGEIRVVDSNGAIQRIIPFADRNRTL
jgi:hypothetical protein